MKDKEPVTYLLAFLGLMVLLGLTIWAGFASLGSFGPVVSLGIASAKAAIVLVFFMRLRHSSPLVRIFAVGGFYWLSILFLFTLADVLTRGNL